MIRDEDIIRLVLRGDTQDYAELMRRYSDSVFRLAYRVLGRREDAEDATQDIFLKAYHALESCRDRGKFWPWLRKITLNTCLTKLSRQSPPVEAIDVLEIASSECVEEEALKRAEAEDLRRAVAGLPADYRIVLVLKYQEGLTCGEIAELLNERVDAVYTRLHRARKMLAERLAVTVNQ